MDKIGPTLSSVAGALGLGASPELMAIAFLVCVVGFALISVSKVLEAISKIMKFVSDCVRWAAWLVKQILRLITPNESPKGPPGGSGKRRSGPSSNQHFVTASFVMRAI